MFNSVEAKRKTLLDVVISEQWKLKADETSVATFQYYAVTVSPVRSVEDFASVSSYLPLLEFLRMNTKTADQCHILEGKMPLVLFDTPAAATVSVRMLTQGLDHCSVNLVSMKMNVPLLVKSLCTVPESSCFTGYSVMWLKGDQCQDTSSQMKEMFQQATEVGGMVASVKLDGPDYVDLRKIRQDVSDRRTACWLVQCEVSPGKVRCGMDIIYHICLQETPQDPGPSGPAGRFGSVRKRCFFRC